MIPLYKAIFYMIEDYVYILYVWGKRETYHAIDYGYRDTLYDKLYIYSDTLYD